MAKRNLWRACVCLLMVASAAWAASPAGLVAAWNLDEGKGDVARDSSGHGRDAKLSGATWEKQGDGFVLGLNGMDSYADCGAVGITGPVSLEAWVKPMRKGHGEACLLGESMSSFLLTYYNTEVACWYIGAGSNGLEGKLNLGEWNHVAATFDGKTMNLWVNGRLARSRESKFQKYETEGRIRIGTQGRPDLPKFKGMLARVRVYDRGLSEGEVVAHFKDEAAGYGFDPSLFSRVKVAPYYYFDLGRIVVEADYRGLQPLEGKGRIEVTLSNQANPKEAIQTQQIADLPASGVTETTLPCQKLAAGDYVIRVSLQDAKAARPVEEVTFSYPPKPSAVPPPAETTAGPLPGGLKFVSFGVNAAKGGGFQLTVKGAVYPFESRISWPNGDFNRLTAGDEPYAKGEKSWKVSVQAAGENHYEVTAGGDSYTVRRGIAVFPTHVCVTDTYTNTTDKDLGLLIYNEMALKPGQVTGSWLSGYEGRGRRAEMSYPDYAPTVFLTDANAGIGIVPTDDVYIVHSVPYVEEEAAGMGDEKFALGPGKSYTLEWAIYPTGSKDYYDFVNAFRKVEGRIGTVEGAPGFISHGVSSHRQVPDPDFVRKRALKIGIIGCLSFTEDDPQLSVEGIEFTDFPKEMQLLKEQALATHVRNPGLRVIFHIAHSLYCTNKPDRFADSKVITADGTQAVWGSDGYFSKERQKEGWQWYIYYPTPGNSFHNALMKSVDVLMDDLGCDGAFMDGFMSGYISQWTYDRWDDHSAEIDPATKTIKRKMGSVILLSQPSMIEFTRKIRDKGGVVVANNTVYTRSICNEKHIIFDNECASGPEMHFAPTATVLGAPPFKTEKDVYLDMLDKLSWGELFLYYSDRFKLTYPSLAAREFPITFEEIRSGLVRGKERIITMNSGVYGWPGDRFLHAVHKFDSRGAPVPNDFNTTVDNTGVRTELKFRKNESAVIERLPVSLEAAAPVNVRVLQYDDVTRLLLNGQGDATLNMFVGTEYPDKNYGQSAEAMYARANIVPGAAYRVTLGGVPTTIKAADGMLAIPLKMNGQMEVIIERASTSE
jgi:hypothetical protein